MAEISLGLENGAVILLKQRASEIALHGVAEDNRRDTAVLSVTVLKLAVSHLVVSQFWVRALNGFECLIYSLRHRAFLQPQLHLQN